MNQLQKQFKERGIPELKQKLGLHNTLAVPRLIKVVINVGAGQALKDAHFLDTVTDSLQRITGQKPVSTKAKRSISNFKIRKGMIVGVKVTLRGQRMYDFVDKLVNVALPRVRDFRGLPLSGFDRAGNYVIGIKEHNVFPEIRSDEIERLHGLEISVVTTAKNVAAGSALLKVLGFPLQET